MSTPILQRDLVLESLKIDYDDQTNKWLNEVKPNAEKPRQHKLTVQRKKEEKERRDQIRRAREARTIAAREQEANANATGMPGMGGMPGRGGMLRIDGMLRMDGMLGMGGMPGSGDGMFNSENVVNSLAVLHNIAIDLKEEPISDDDEETLPSLPTVPSSQNTLHGAAVRAIFIDENFKV